MKGGKDTHVDPRMLPPVKLPELEHIEHARNVERARAVLILRRADHAPRGYAVPLVPVGEVGRDRVLDVQVPSQQIRRVLRGRRDVQLFRDEVAVVSCQTPSSSSPSLAAVAARLTEDPKGHQ